MCITNKSSDDGYVTLLVRMHQQRSCSSVDCQFTMLASSPGMPTISFSGNIQLRMLSISCAKRGNACKFRTLKLSNQLTYCQRELCLRLKPWTLKMASL